MGNFKRKRQQIAAFPLFRFMHPVILEFAPVCFAFAIFRVYSVRCSVCGGFQGMMLMAAL
jgi:hypothetical protein